MGWALWWVLQGFCVGIGMQAGYTLGQWAVGISWLGQWTFGAFLFLPFHYPPQSTKQCGFPMDKQWHQYLRVPIIGAADTTPPPWCHLGTLPLDSLPLDDQDAGQALKLNTASCQVYAPFHFEVHQFSCLHCFP